MQFTGRQCPALDCFCPFGYGNLYPLSGVEKFKSLTCGTDALQKGLIVRSGVAKKYVLHLDERYGVFALKGYFAATRGIHLGRGPGNLSRKSYILATLSGVGQTYAKSISLSEKTLTMSDFLERSSSAF